ncbi:unnamed protein product, partial [Symbiodinium natans]
ADVLRALASSLPAVSKPEPENFQQRWQQFQAQLGGLSDVRTPKHAGAPVAAASQEPREAAPAATPTNALVAEESLTEEPEPVVQELSQVSSRSSRMTRLVPVVK